MEEKTITGRMALEFVAAVVMGVSALVALFSLIWAAWHTFRVAVTVFVVVALASVAVEYVADVAKRIKDKKTEEK